MYAPMASRVWIDGGRLYCRQTKASDSNASACTSFRMSLDAQQDVLLFFPLWGKSAIFSRQRTHLVQDVLGRRGAPQASHIKAISS